VVQSLRSKSITGATPALTDKSIQEKIVRATKSLNLTYKQMQSGAGHDSQDMALIAPIGMIFVPSVAGISHSQKSLAKQLIWRMERTYCSSNHISIRHGLERSEVFLLITGRLTI
jgi:hypothetical protein